MKTVIGTASALLMAAVATTVIATPAMAQKKAKPQSFKFSKAVQPLLAEVQKKQTANDHDGALATLAQASALPNLTADDNYMINMLTLNSAITKNDNALMEKAIEGALNTGRLSAEDEPKFRRNLGALALQRQDYAKAATQFEMLVASNPNDTELLMQIAELQRRQKQPQKAIATINQAIAVQEAAGQKASDETYRRALGIAYDSKLPAEIASTSTAMLKAHPTPTNWRDALVIFRDSAKLDDQATLDVLRLMRANGALAGERDYAEFAETAALRGYPGEAKTVLDEGVKKGALDPSKGVIKELSTSINTRAAGDRASLPAAEREARSSSNARAIAGTADAFLGYGENAKAAELYKLALTKTGADTDLINTRLGLTLGLTGDKAGAEAALKAVKPGTPRARLAELYLIWLAHRP